jgi:hypothetical protein
MFVVYTVGESTIVRDTFPLIHESKAIGKLEESALILMRRSLFNLAVDYSTLLDNE